MTKIEAFKQAKFIADKIKRAVDCILCRDSAQNDKGHMTVYFTGLANADWNPMNFQIHASHGYFGSSSGYSDTSEELGRYFAKAIEAYKSTLLDYAASLAAKDAEAARKAAEDEARAVLTETAA